MVMDMGQHVVQDYAQPLTLHQVMVPGLEDRARTFPNLSTAKQLSPGVQSRPGIWDGSRTGITVYYREKRSTCAVFA